jgi:hypothetical protein
MRERGDIETWKDREREIEERDRLKRAKHEQVYPIF